MPLPGIRKERLMEEAIAKEYRQMVEKLGRRWFPMLEQYFQREAPEVSIFAIRDFIKRNPAAFVLGCTVDSEYLRKCVDELREQYG